MFLHNSPFSLTSVRKCNIIKLADFGSGADIFTLYPT